MKKHSVVKSIAIGAIIGAGIYFIKYKKSQKKTFNINEDDLVNPEIFNLTPGITPERIAIEKEKCKEPAPFIVYAKHKNGTKEFAWRLYTDIDKRQGIDSGD